MIASTPTQAKDASMRDTDAAARQGWRAVLTIAAWTALLGGIVEGAGMLVFQRVSDNTRYVSADILWVAPTVYAVAFTVLAVLIVLAARISPRLQTPWLRFFPFAVLVLAAWLETAGLASRVNVFALGALALGLATVATRGFASREQEVMRAWRRTLPLMAVATVLLFVIVRGGGRLREQRALQALSADAVGKPNVLLIVLDALRADHVGAYGYSRPTTPNIDRIAAEGVLYENAFSTSPWSLPAHASLMTGRHPSELGIGWTAAEALQNGDAPILSEVLRDHGYRTAAISANVFWVTHERFGRGFIRFEDYFHSIPDMILRTNLGRGVERFIMQRIGIEDIPARKSATDINRSLLRWVDRSSEQPFFALVNYFDVHDPYLPPDAYRNRFAQGDPGGLLNWRVGRSDPDLSAAEIESEIAAYDGVLSYLDAQIGVLRAALEERGVLDNTILVLVSDHGEAFGERGWFLHGHSLYLDQLHVPMIVRWPSGVPAGVRASDVVSIAAVPGLVMDLIDGPAAFATATTTGATTPMAYAEAEKKSWAPEDSPAFVTPLAAVLDDEWHLIRTERGESELFRWRVDPLGKRDLAGSPGADSVIRRLSTALESPWLVVPARLGDGPARQSHEK